MVWMDHIVFIRSSDNGHLGCFHLLAIVNDAAMNMSTQIPIWVPALYSFGLPYIFKANPRRGLSLLTLGNHIWFFREWGWEDRAAPHTEDSSCDSPHGWTLPPFADEIMIQERKTRGITRQYAVKYQMRQRVKRKIRSSTNGGFTVNYKAR